MYMDTYSFVQNHTMTVCITVSTGIIMNSKINIICITQEGEEI